MHVIVTLATIPSIPNTIFSVSFNLGICCRPIKVVCSSVRLGGYNIVEDWVWCGVVG